MMNTPLAGMFGNRAPEFQRHFTPSEFTAIGRPVFGQE